jgi:hypothetical protein
MSCTNQPTLAGFQAFIADVMGIDPLYLPSGSPAIPMAYQVALTIVSQQLAYVPTRTQPGMAAGPSIYALAVYNLAGSNIINFASDQPGRTYFQAKRERLGIGKFTPGVVAGTSDQGSATSLLNQEFMKNLTLANLQNLKDEYGRQYLMFAQLAGPTIWGLT